jgi:hypothetical protein
LAFSTIFLRFLNTSMRDSFRSNGIKVYMQVI